MTEFWPLALVATFIAAAMLVLHGVARRKAEASAALSAYESMLREIRESDGCGSAERAAEPPASDEPPATSDAV